MMEEKKILLSIIVPVYNSEKYLEKCINSILTQTYSNFELILVDDASTDMSGKICDKLAQGDKRIKVFHHIENKGLSASREDGFKISRGEWVSFIDNDDYIHPKMYEKLIKSAVEGDMLCIRGEDATTEEIDHVIWLDKQTEFMILEGREACNKVYSKALDLGFVEPIWGKIIKRTLVEDVLEKMNQYKENLHWVYMEDVIFTPFLFFYASKVVFINELMYLHRRISNNLSSTLIPRVYHYEAVEAGDILLTFFENQGLVEAYDKHLVGYFMLVMSTWYKMWKNEKDVQRCDWFEKRISELYEKYRHKIRRCSTKGIFEEMEKVMVLWFDKHRTLWGKTIGKLYFEFWRKITY